MNRLELLTILGLVSGCLGQGQFGNFRQGGFDNFPPRYEMPNQIPMPQTLRYEYNQLYNKPDKFDYGGKEVDFMREHGFDDIKVFDKSEYEEPEIDAEKTIADEAKIFWDENECVYPPKVS